MAKFVYGGRGTASASTPSGNAERDNYTSRTLKLNSRKYAKRFRLLRQLDVNVKGKILDEIRRVLNCRNRNIDVSCSSNAVHLFIPESIDKRRDEIRRNDGLRDLRCYIKKVVNNLTEKLEGTDITHHL